MRRTSSSGAPSRRPTKRTRAPRSCMSGTCESIISMNSCISASTSSFGPVPVLGAEGVDRDLLDAEVERVLEHAAQRLGACPVPRGHGQAPALRPAAVAVHDDGEVAAGGAAGRRLCGARRRSAGASAPATCAARPCGGSSRSRRQAPAQTSRISGFLVLEQLVDLGARGRPCTSAARPRRASPRPRRPRPRGRAP